jgi:hypothetical protein
MCSRCLMCSVPTTIVRRATPMAVHGARPTASKKQRRLRVTKYAPLFAICCCCCYHANVCVFNFTAMRWQSLDKRTSQRHAPPHRFVLVVVVVVIVVLCVPHFCGRVKRNDHRNRS